MLNVATTIVTIRTAKAARTKRVVVINQQVILLGCLM